MLLMFEGAEGPIDVDVNVNCASKEKAAEMRPPLINGSAAARRGALSRALAGPGP